MKHETCLKIYTVCVGGGEIIWYICTINTRWTIKYYHIKLSSPLGFLNFRIWNITKTDYLFPFKGDNFYLILQIVVHFQY